MKPRFPLYIVSKSRAKSKYTVNALLRMSLDFLVIVEQHQYADYAAEIDSKYLLLLDPAFQDTYNTCDTLGTIKSKGPGPARNFAWDHARNNGYLWRWVMDDNIQNFYRMNQNLQAIEYSGNSFYAMEEFCLRYINVVMAGPAYHGFTPSRGNPHPFVLNTRIYSCNLIRNDIEWRWRGRYNEDTDLSLRILKSGLCTIQFNAFLQDKSVTQRHGGGNSQEFYSQEGTLEKTKMLVKLHPDVTKIVMRWDRVHHLVNYRPFRHNRLIRNSSVIIPSGPCQFNSMLLKR